MPESGSSTPTPAPTRTILPRPQQLAELSSLARVVALVGPVGAGATTLLRQWASQHEHVTWAAAGSIPDPHGIPDRQRDVLIVDQADDLMPDDWQRLRALRAQHPDLIIRLALHTRRSLPADDDVEIVNCPSFTITETREYLAACGSQLDPVAVYVSTGGLPAAVRAVVQLGTTRGQFVNAALALLPPGALAPALSRLAVPEVLTQKIVTELGGPADFIDQTERAGQGAWTADAGRPLFVLTAPVRAATLQAYPVPEADAIRAQAAQTLLAQAAWHGALIEGAASGSLAVVDAALRGGGMPLLRMHGASITARLQGIALWELRRWPIIAMAQALSYNARHQHQLRAIELMGVALIGARSTPPGSSDRALLRVIESVLQRLLGVGDGGVKAARAAAKILDELPAEEYRAIEGLIGDLHSHAAISLMNGGQTDEALVEFERTLGVTGRPGLELMSLGGVALIHGASGDLETGQSWVDTALARSWSDSILNEYQGSMLRMAQARLLIEQNDLDGADEALDRVWPIIDTIEHWPMLAHLRALVAACRGEADAGLERFRALRRRRGTRISRAQKRLLDMTDATLALAAGDLDAARSLAPRDDDPPSVLIAAARTLVFDGNFERARTVLAGIRAETPDERAGAAVLDAIVLRRFGRDEDAATAAHRARTITDAYGLKTPFLLVASDDRELFGDVFPWPAPNAGALAVPPLTVRERVILRELVHSSSVTEISQRLHVSVNTVKSQRRSLYRKLGAASRDEALAIATAHGMLNG